MSGKVNRGFSA